MQESVSLTSHAQPQTLDVAILCSSPVLALGIQHVLEDWSGDISCHRAGPRDWAGTAATPAADALIIAPRCWEEMAAWLPDLRRHAPETPWLLLTEKRMAGMFLSCLAEDRCAVVDPNASPEELVAVVRSATRGECGHLTAELLAQFARAGFRKPPGVRTVLPSRQELQCACGVSLGLSNKEIARILHLSESGVKSHLYRVMNKLRVSNRHGLRTMIKQALI